MRTSTLFTASLALLALLLTPAAASPTGAPAADAVDTAADDLDFGVVAPAAGDLADTSSTELVAGNATDVFAPLAPGPYDVDCGRFPNVCENWCYYVFCRKTGADKNAAFWTVTVNRNAGLRPQSECGRLSPNKCSVNSVRPWPANPVANQDCDEQPKNTNDEGGANAATRCMDRSENRGEGSSWANYINNGGPGRIADGTRIRVTLSNPAGPLCASYRRARTTMCPAPASPMDANVGRDAIRQQ
ncbi:hypothetical protein PsYK624_160970 [Phanerochaete sordida]|uniref:Deoxyribonuclease NucA/NucB domain-containing protein n=1 Tax=Phanerochaete sordida TaxID=48140 RepID=A0A9P3GUL2_9APHY|nr:hypothetical protein PsYK624_160970 [Phanerochaete sordida]